MKFLNNAELERSSVVANCAMNRERKISGPNSYTKELHFNPLPFLKQRLQNQSRVAWLDLCCGSGRALIEVAQDLCDSGLADCVRLVGIDLVPMFWEHPCCLHNLELRSEALSQWDCKSEYDLITCVHGLHYIGNKLRTIEEAAVGLTADGVFLAHLDLNNIKFADGTLARQHVIATLKDNDFTYNPRKHLLCLRGKQLMQFPYRYLGSDDEAGPNYTGQPAVDSYYDYSQLPTRTKGAQ